MASIYDKKRLNLTKKFDPIFLKYASDIPVEYLRTLGFGESLLRPTSKTGKHWGLFSISPTVVQEVNDRTDSTWTHKDMLLPGPATYTYHGYWFHIITKSLSRWADEPFMQEMWKGGWNNPQYAALMTMAWNSGIGVTNRAIDWLVKQGQVVTHSKLFNYKLSKHASSHDKKLLSAKKRRWQAAVAYQYMLQLKKPPGSKPPGKPTSGGGAGALLLLALLLFFTKGDR